MFLQKLSLSWALCRKLPNLTITAMLVALGVVLNFFTLDFGAFLKVSFSGLPIAVVGMMFGPVTGGLAGLAADLVKYITHPTGAFFPGFTFNAMLTGFIYGAFLFQAPVRLPRILLCRLTVTVVINVCLNTLWLYMLYGPSMLTALPVRLLKNLISYPLDAAILWMLAGCVQRVMMRLRKVPR